MSSENPEKVSRGALVEQIVEKFLWNTRLIILLGVFGLLASSAVIFLLGVFETISLVNLFFYNILHHGIHIDGDLYNKIIVQIITTVDDFLLGIVLLIFGLGTYDLFISRLDHAHSQEDLRPDWLIFNSLDELKSVLSKVVLMILTINFLKLVVNMEFTEPLHLLYLGGGIALVSLALKLSHGKDVSESTAAQRLKTDHEFREVAKQLLNKADD